MTFALKYLRDLGKLATTGTIAMAVILVIIAWIMDYTTTKLDRIFFERVHEIERNPLIEMEGHHKLYEEKIKCNWWYFTRKLTWPVIFLTLLVFYILTFIISLT